MGGRQEEQQEILVARLDAARARDFYSLHGSPPFEWCHCVAWTCPTWDGWGERTVDENRSGREEIFAAGRFDGYLLYVNGVVVGWCQCGPRDGWPKLAAQFELAPDPGVWAVTCFCIRPEVRRQGMARRLLGSILEDLRGCGVTRVEGFPRARGEHEDGEVWTGPLELFEQAGFKVVKDTGRRLVVALDLTARATGGANARSESGPSTSTRRAEGVLARYQDPTGRITHWPRKRSVKDLVLEYLASKVENERNYSEAEINDMLLAWHTFGDPALLRRELFDHGFLARNKDGSRYWRTVG